jgi:hypothetical protein
MNVKPVLFMVFIDYVMAQLLKVNVSARVIVNMIDINALIFISGFIVILVAIKRFLL